jgi:hypothetical protein
MLGHVVLDAMRGAEAPVLSFHGAPQVQNELFSVVDALRPQLPSAGQIRLCMAAAPAQIADGVSDTRQVA